MNKIGFTLIELLGVIIILSLLIILVLPRITNSVRNYSSKTDELTFSIIKEATKLYIDDNINDFPQNIENSYCVTLNKLIAGDYLKAPIEINGVDITDTKSLQITYDSGYNIELVDNVSCVVKQTYVEE